MYDLKKTCLRKSNVGENRQHDTQIEKASNKGKGEEWEGGAAWSLRLNMPLKKKKSDCRKRQKTQTSGGKDNRKGGGEGWKGST